MDNFLIEGAPLSKAQASALLQVLSVASLPGGQAVEVVKAQIALERIVNGVDVVQAIKGLEEQAAMPPMPRPNPVVAPES